MLPALDLSNLPDADVVALAREGREEAYRELVRRYERTVFTLIFRMVRDRELAEDLAQDTFVKVLKSLHQYRPEFKFSNWVIKIANNVAIDQMRRRKPEMFSLSGSPEADSADAISATSLDIIDDSESPDDELEARELGTALERAIGELRPVYRSCIILALVEGRSYEEIAATLDIPMGTVKTHIHRARQELRVALAGTRHHD